MLRDEMPSSRPVRQGVLVEIKGELKTRKHVTFWLLLTKLQDSTGDGQHVITQVPNELKLRTRLPTVGCEGHAESAYDEHAKADKIEPGKKSYCQAWMTS